MPNLPGRPVLAPMKDPGGFGGGSSGARIASAPADPEESDKKVRENSAPRHSVQPRPGQASSIADDMPAELRAQIEGIVTWAKSNGRDAFWQGIYFWSLKTPVVISAGAYGALSYFDQKAWAVAVGGIAGVCALIDGLLRPGQLYRFFSVAEYGLMSLSNRAWADWSAGKLRGEDRNTLAARIIDYTEDEKLKISATLSDAASTLGGSAPISTAGAPSEKVKGAST